MRAVGTLWAAGLLWPRSALALRAAIRRHGSTPSAALAYAARRHSAQVALVDTRESVTFRALADRSDRLRGALRAADIGSGDSVGFLATSDVSGVAALFALTAERADVSLAHPGTPQKSAEQLACALGWSVLMGPAESVGSLPSSVRIGDLWAVRLAPRKSGGPGSITVLTGGTTGTPRAAQRRGTGAEVLAPFSALVRDVRIADHRVAYLGAPIHHGFGLSALIAGVLLGATQLLTPRFDAAVACRMTAAHGATAMVVVPTMLRRMLAADSAALDSVRTVLCGSAPLDEHLARDVGARMSADLWNMYGTSEAGFGVLASPEMLERHPGTIGAPIPGVLARIVDDHGGELADGSVGRLQLRSRAAVKHDAWIDTGDLAHREPDGALLLHGREDDLLQVGGETIAPAAVEDVLTRHPGVAQCAVVGVPDVELGTALVAVVVPGADPAARDGLPERLGSWMRDAAPPGNRPHRIVLARDLPLTAVHKLDRRALTARIAASG